LNPVAILKTLGPIDAKALRRDSFLRWIVFIPLLLGAVMFWGVPALTQLPQFRDRFPGFSGT